VRLNWIQKPVDCLVGSGENNSQRRVSYGDGVYKSDDGGAVEKRRAKEVRAHRSHRYRSAEHGRRLRRSAGSLVGTGRRPRVLQDNEREEKTWKDVLTIARTPVSVTSSWIEKSDVLYASAYQTAQTCLDGDRWRSGERYL
jgi:hypothetical protein